MPTSEPRPKPLVVLASGGLDSTVLAASLLAEGHPLIAVSFEYGQKHLRELDSAASVMAWLGIDHRIIDVRGLGKISKGSALTGEIPVPHGHYAEESMKATVVPHRNTIFVAFAAALAMQEGFAGVAIAAHGGDHAIYPDCRKEWVEAVQNVIRLGCWDADGFEIHAPFLSMTKSDIVIRGVEVDAPLRRTWSCYEGGRIHCGLCGTCVERKEAFERAGIVDPTEYAA